MVSWKGVLCSSWLDSVRISLILALEYLTLLGVLAVVFVADGGILETLTGLVCSPSSVLALPVSFAKELKLIDFVLNRVSLRG